MLPEVSKTSVMSACFLFACQRVEDGVHHIRLPALPASSAVRFGSTPCAASIGAASGTSTGAGPEAVRNRLLLLRSREQVVDVDLRRFLFLRRHPRPLDDADRMIAPERSFLRIDRRRPERAASTAKRGLDNHVLVEHRRGEIFGPLANISRPKKPVELP